MEVPRRRESFGTIDPAEVDMYGEDFARRLVISQNERIFNRPATSHEGRMLRRRFPFIVTDDEVAIALMSELGPID